MEEIEIKQRSLASVKRARLKEKKTTPEGEKKEFKKVLRDVKIPEQLDARPVLVFLALMLVRPPFW